jgi:hypothetical protein
MAASPPTLIGIPRKRRPMQSSPTPYVLWNVVSAAIRLSLTTPRICCSSRVRPPRSALRKPKDNISCSSGPVLRRALWAPYDLKLHFLSNAYLGVLILSA